jgi:hypothetical protein
MCVCECVFVCVSVYVSVCVSVYVCTPFPRLARHCHPRLLVGTRTVAPSLNIESELARTRTDDLKASVWAFEEFDVQSPVHTAWKGNLRTGVAPWGGAACTPHLDHASFSAALEEASDLRLSTRLSADGTKTVHAHVGQLFAMCKVIL